MYFIAVSIVRERCQPSGQCVQFIDDLIPRELVIQGRQGYFPPGDPAIGSGGFHSREDSACCRDEPFTGSSSHTLLFRYVYCPIGSNCRMSHGHAFRRPGRMDTVNIASWLIRALLRYIAASRECTPVGTAEGFPTFRSYPVAACHLIIRQVVYGVQHPAAHHGIFP